MRKKFSLLMSSMLLFMMGSANTQAQSVEDLGAPLITDVSQLSSNASDEAEGQHIEYVLDGDANTYWHTDWHNKCQDQYHYLQVKLNEEFTGDIVITMIRRAIAENDHPTEMLVQGSLDGTSYTDIATVALPFSGKSTPTTSEPFRVASPVKYLRFNVTNCTGSEIGYRKYWHCAEFQLYVKSHSEAVRNYLNNILTKYDGYLYGESFNVGKEFGQYDAADIVPVFLEKLKYACDIYSEVVEWPSDDVVEALTVEIDELYAKILATEVLYKIPGNGYYRLYSNLHYYENNATGQNEEPGGVVEKMPVVKAMYSTLEGECRWGTYKEGDCRFIWKLTQGEGSSVDIVNAGTDMRFADFNNPVRMSLDGSYKVAFDFAGKENNRTVVYIRPDYLARGGSNYFHQLGHGLGTGVDNSLCLWDPTFTHGEEYDTDKGSSEWYLEPVSDEEAQRLIEAFEPYKNHDKLVLKYKELKEQCQSALALAEDKSAAYTPDIDGGGLITENSQFSSNCTESCEGSIENLLDGNSDTYWHSSWTNGKVPNHSHSIDISFAIPLAPGAYQAWVQRRGSGTCDDNPVLFSVYGSNDESALANTDETGWTLIASNLSDPWTNGVVETWMDAFELKLSYKYIRFYNDGTRGPYESGYDRGFWHMGGFQLYHAQKVGSSQIENMGQVGIDFQNAVNRACNIADADISVSEYEALQQAYEAFKNALVDPTPLRETLDAYKDASSILAIGENPGFWPNESTATALNSAIDEATEYCRKGQFDKATVEGYLKKIVTANKNFLDAANKVQPNKWYKFRFPTQEIYDKYSKDSSPATGSSLGKALGRYVTVGAYRAADEAQGITEGIDQTPEGDVREGASMWLVDNPEYEDLSMFRFVAVADTAYAIQNKATGLFINIQASNNNNVTLSLTPTLFDVTALGGGTNLMHGRTLKGVERTCLHVQNSNQRLVSWESNNFGSNSNWLIETAGDVEDGYKPTFVKEIIEGKFYPMCYPVAIAPQNGEKFTVEGTFRKNDKNYLAMNELEGESIEAGKPVVFLVGEPEGYVAPAEGETPEYTEVNFTVDASNIVADPMTVNGFVGVFDNNRVDEGIVVFCDNTIVTAEGDTRNVRANMGYVMWGAATANPDTEYSLVMEINGTPNAIKSVEQASVQGKQGIYTLSGCRVNKAVKGVYIIDGKKYVK